MSYGSYYTADYYRNPVPYTSSDIGEPVPGWGTTISIAGPPRLGVGALGIVRAPFQSLTPAQRALLAEKVARVKAGLPPLTTDDAVTTAADAAVVATVEEDKPMPWWIWPVAAAVVLGGVGYVGTKQGWL